MFVRVLRLHYSCKFTFSFFAPRVNYSALQWDKEQVIEYYWLVFLQFHPSDSFCCGYGIFSGLQLFPYPLTCGFQTWTYVRITWRLLKVQISGPSAWSFWFRKSGVGLGSARLRPPQCGAAGPRIHAGQVPALTQQAVKWGCGSKRGGWIQTNR